MALIDQQGSEILVHKDPQGLQISPDVSLLSDGRFVVAWEQDPSRFVTGDDVRHILGQYYTSSGAPIGSAFQIDSDVALDTEVAVTPLADGGFIATWANYRNPHPGEQGAADIEAQIFAADGTKVGSEIAVNTLTNFDQILPKITTLSTGGFVATWITAGRNPDGSLFEQVRAQIFAADGTKVGDEITANTGDPAPSSSVTAFTPQTADVIALDDGRFVVTTAAFASAISHGLSSGAEDFKRSEAQIFDASGNKVGPQILVDDGFRDAPATAKLANGDFVLAWGNGHEVKAQVYDANGAKVGAEAFIADAGRDPIVTVAAVGNGDFAVAWTDQSGTLGDTDGSAIAAQLFDAGGSAITSVFRVNNDTTYSQGKLEATGSPDGHLVISWYDDETFVHTAIRAQVLIDNHDTNHPVVFTSDGGGNVVSVNVAENNSAATTVHATAEGIATPVSYAILGGQDAALFGVDATTGALTFKAAPDFETPSDADHDNVYQVVVGATVGDAAGSQTISVNVTDAFEPATYQGTAGADVFAGTKGHNWTIDGLAGDDRLTGNSSADVITGGAGKDVMTGGGGADIFVFAPGDSKAGGGVRDIITDFATGTDKLDLTALHITDFAAQVSYKTVGSGLIVYVDTNHNGFDYADFGVQLTGVHSVSQSDFIL